MKASPRFAMAFPLERNSTGLDTLTMVQCARRIALLMVERTLNCRVEEGANIVPSQVHRMCELIRHLVCRYRQGGGPG